MRAKPKSQSLMTPVLVRRMFSGFTSRCMHCNINTQHQGYGNSINGVIVTEREDYIRMTDEEWMWRNNSMSSETYKHFNIETGY